MTIEPDFGQSEIAQYIWQTRYCHASESSLAETLARVARALAEPEPIDRARWAQRFFDVMRTGAFIPGGRILAGAGTGDTVTLFNCFVMAPIMDMAASLDRALSEGAATLRQGGGVGYDLSGLATGETLACLDRLEAMCAGLRTMHVRCGAMMATLSDDHPDIESFIEAKRGAGRLSHFNLSVLVSDALVDAAAADRQWPLCAADGERGTVSARALWDRLVRAAYDSAEPGVLFIDRINLFNNLRYCEHIGATNPCGEIPLPAYGACDLGSLNLATFVRDAFTADARLDLDAIADATRTGVRMLDNVIEVSGFPLPVQHDVVRRSRRVGIGMMGLADTLVLLGLRYDSAAGRSLAATAMRTICHAAYDESTVIAGEKGSFPLLDRERYLSAPFIRALPEALRARIAQRGLRNSHLVAIAPTGTISLLADHVSSGLEPILAPSVSRAVHQPGGGSIRFALEAWSLQRWRDKGKRGRPPALLCAEEIDPFDQLRMQAALQPYIDNAISKTVTVPADYALEDFAKLYESAAWLGLKGCAAYRPQQLRPPLVMRSNCRGHALADMAPAPLTHC